MNVLHLFIGMIYEEGETEEREWARWFLPLARDLHCGGFSRIRKVRMHELFANTARYTMSETHEAKRADISTVFDGMLD